MTSSSFFHRDDKNEKPNTPIAESFCMVPVNKGLGAQFIHQDQWAELSYALIVKTAELIKDPSKLDAAIRHDIDETIALLKDQPKPLDWIDLIHEYESVMNKSELFIKKIYYYLAINRFRIGFLLNQHSMQSVYGNLIHQGVTTDFTIHSQRLKDFVPSFLECKKNGNGYPFSSGEFVFYHDEEQGAGRLNTTVHATAANSNYFLKIKYVYLNETMFPITEIKALNANAVSVKHTDPLHHSHVFKSCDAILSFLINHPEKEIGSHAYYKTMGVLAYYLAQIVPCLGNASIVEMLLFAVLKSQGITLQQKNDDKCWDVQTMLMDSANQFLPYFYDVFMPKKQEVSDKMRFLDIGLATNNVDLIKEDEWIAKQDIAEIVKKLTTEEYMKLITLLIHARQGKLCVKLMEAADIKVSELPEPLHAKHIENMFIANLNPSSLLSHEKSKLLFDIGCFAEFNLLYNRPLKRIPINKSISIFQANELIEYISTRNTYQLPLMLLNTGVVSYIPGIINHYKRFHGEVTQTALTKLLALEDPVLFKTLSMAINRYTLIEVLLKYDAMLPYFSKLNINNELDTIIQLGVMLFKLVLKAPNIEHKNIYLSQIEKLKFSDTTMAAIMSHIGLTDKKGFEKISNYIKTLDPKLLSNMSESDDILLQQFAKSFMSTNTGKTKQTENATKEESQHPKRHK